MEEYTCEHCGNTFQNGRSEKEALQEASENFPGVSKEKMGEICDNCYKEFMSWFEIIREKQEVYLNSLSNDDSIAEAMEKAQISEDDYQMFLEDPEF